MTAKLFFEQIRSQLTTIYEPPQANSVAFLVVEKLFQLSRNQLIINERTFTKSDWNRLKPYLERLLNHEPVQYVLGEGYFYGRAFEVSSDVLIPRPETEELVDLIIKQNQKNTNLTLLDIGTGSGCIPITLFHHLPQAEVHALDISEKALRIAQQNAHKLQANIRFHQFNILKNNLDELPDFEIIVSNPPYVRLSEKWQMQANVLDYEPELALFVPDGSPLLFYERIAQIATQKLKINGKLYFEINEAFGESVVKLLEKYNFKQISLCQDMQNRDRIVFGNK